MGATTLRTNKAQLTVKDPYITSAVTVTHGATGNLAITGRCIVYAIVASLPTASNYPINLYDQTSTTIVSGNLKIALNGTVQTGYSFPQGILFENGVVLTAPSGTVDPAVYITYQPV